MNKTGIKELAQTLVEKYGLEKSAAEDFVEQLFSVLAHGLETDRQVKVKGLGTFKVVGVASRKSVDVNTGEPIVIEGRDKISFTPDATMRDRVNRPFAQFDTVVVNDGVDFSAIDEKYASSLEEGNSQEVTNQDTAEKKAESSPKEIEEAADNSEKTDTTATPANTTEDTPEVNVAEATIPTKEETIVPEEIEKNITSEKDEEVQAPIEKTETPTTERTEKNTTEPADDDTNSVNTDLLRQEVIKQHRLMRWVMCGVVVLLLACLGGIFFLANQLSKRDHRIEHLEAQAMMRKQSARVKASADNTISPAPVQKVKADSLAEKKQQKPTTQQGNAKEQIAKNQQQKEDNRQKTTNDEPSSTSKKATVKTTDEVPSQAEYNKDPRIRTGAYIIIGVDHTITVRPGQTMASISRSTLGPGMDCYLEAINGGTRELKAGEKIRIPKLKLKKKKK